MYRALALLIILSKIVKVLPIYCQAIIYVVLKLLIASMILMLAIHIAVDIVHILCF